MEEVATESEIGVVGGLSSSSRSPTRYHSDKWEEKKKKERKAKRREEKVRKREEKKDGGTTREKARANESLINGSNREIGSWRILTDTGGR